MEQLHQVKKAFFWIPALLVVISIHLFMPESAYADLDIEGCYYETGPGGELREKSNGFTRKIVECIDTIFKEVTEEQFNDINEFFQQFATALLTIYVTIFGYRLVMGDIKKAGSEMMMVALMVCTVVYFVNQSGMSTFYGIFKGLQRELVDVVQLNVVFDKTNEQAGICSLRTWSNGAGDDPTDESQVNQRYPTVWQSLDCMIAVFFGSSKIYRDDTTGELQGEHDSLIFSPPGDTDPSGEIPGKAPYIPLAIVVGFLLTSVGTLIALAMLIVVIQVVSGIVQAIISYTAALMALTFLALFAPLFFPLILFNKTRFMFAAWLRMAIGYVVSPALLFAYIAMMIQVLHFGILGTDIADAGEPCIYGETRSICGASFEVDTCFGFITPLSKTSVWGVLPYYSRLKDSWDSARDYPSAENTVMQTILTSQMQTAAEENRVGAVIDSTSEFTLRKNANESGFEAPALVFKLTSNEQNYNEWLKDLLSQNGELCEYPPGFDPTPPAGVGEPLPPPASWDPECCKEEFNRLLVTEYSIAGGFLQSLFALGIATYLMQMFMHNVVRFGHSLAGMAVYGGTNQMAKVYNRVMTQITSKSGKD